MSPRDEARRQYFKDLDDAIIEDVYRTLWFSHRGWFRRKRGKRVSRRSPLRVARKTA